MPSPRLADYVADVARSALAEHAALPPWELTARATTIVTHMLAAVGTGFERTDDVVWHGSARIEQGAIVKGPAVIGPRCLVAAGAYLRGGVWLEEDCVVGPHAEVKASLLFRGARLAHLNFVGDSILGRDVNVEAGAVIANHRNELDDPRIRLHAGDQVIDTGVDTFGALVGDHSRIGANAVLAPGTLLPPRSIVPRLGLIDQGPRARRAPRSGR
jgi:UDP-N-acetylglucosamine diphosphorylase / glucose-1-phosphate thymidylyltransferase / UDP-N-acetylgalactosamine diphosphorylase / glucosamine-1-phosphate N-acetyltransferase / galactosamine-1-phosphate N-acetyltransferase